MKARPLLGTKDCDGQASREETSAAAATDNLMTADLFLRKELF